LFEGAPIVEAREITRVAVTPQHSAFIAERIAHLAEEAPTSQRWLVMFMEVHKVLPLCSGWTWTLGIKPDGTLVRIPTEGEWSETSQEFPDRTAANVALMEGAARYPELRDLIPSRPDDAEPCPTCRGTGELPPPIRCICGGLGWLPPIRSRADAVPKIAKKAGPQPARVGMCSGVADDLSKALQDLRDLLG
jgi:hypothetical protein